jgi:hypothetical protein
VSCILRVAAWFCVAHTAATLSLQRDASLESILALPARLRAMPLSVVWRMQQRGLHAFHTHLASLDVMLEGMFRTLVMRFQAAVGGGPGAVPSLSAAASRPCVDGSGSSFFCGEAVGERRETPATTTPDWLVAAVDEMASVAFDPLELVDDEASAQVEGYDDATAMAWRRYIDGTLLRLEDGMTRDVSLHAVLGTTYHRLALLHLKHGRWVSLSVCAVAAGATLRCPPALLYLPVVAGCWRRSDAHRARCCGLASRSVDLGTSR